jgi:hypothetical protein
MGKVMSKTALHYGCLSLLLTINLCASSSSEARHRRHYGGAQSFEQNVANDRRPVGQLRASDAGLQHSQGGSFGATVEELIRGCSQEAIELKKRPFDFLAQVMGLGGTQLNTFKQVENTSIETADILAATCPKEIPGSITARFDALKQAVDAFIAGLDALQPSMETFYASLNDEQRARLFAMSANNSLETTRQSNRPNRKARIERPASTARCRVHSRSRLAIGWRVRCVTGRLGRLNPAFACRIPSEQRCTT